MGINVLDIEAVDNDSKEVKEFKDLLNWWADHLGLKFTWKITVSYADYLLIDEGDDRYGAEGCCSSDWRYCTANIRFNKTSLIENSHDTNEETAVHELAHIFLNEMREEGREHEERVATSLARAFIMLRDMLVEELTAPAKQQKLMVEPDTDWPDITLTAVSEDPEIQGKEINEVTDDQTDSLI